MPRYVSARTRKNHMCERPLILPLFLFSCEFLHSFFTHPFSVLHSALTSLSSPLLSYVLLPVSSEQARGTQLSNALAQAEASAALAASAAAAAEARAAELEQRLAGASFDLAAAQAAEVATESRLRDGRSVVSAARAGHASAAAAMKSAVRAVLVAMVAPPPAAAAAIPHLVGCTAATALLALCWCWLCLAHSRLTRECPCRRCSSLPLCIFGSRG